MKLLLPGTLAAPGAPRLDSPHPFEWDGRDLTLKARSGQQGTFTRAGISETIDHRGLLRLLHHSQPHFEAVGRHAAAAGGPFYTRDGVRLVTHMAQVNALTVAQANDLASNWTLGGAGGVKSYPVSGPDLTDTASAVELPANAAAWIYRSVSGFTPDAGYSAGFWILTEEDSTFEGGTLNVVNPNLGTSAFNVVPPTPADGWRYVSGQLTASATGHAGVYLITVGGTGTWRGRICRVSCYNSTWVNSPWHAPALIAEEASWPFLAPFRACTIFYEGEPLSPHGNVGGVQPLVGVGDGVYNAANVSAGMNLTNGLVALWFYEQISGTAIAYVEIPGITALPSPWRIAMQLAADGRLTGQAVGADGTRLETNPGLGFPFRAPPANAVWSGQKIHLGRQTYGSGFAAAPGSARRIIVADGYHDVSEL